MILREMDSIYVTGSKFLYARFYGDFAIVI
jgi:hypothetical protein